MNFTPEFHTSKLFRNFKKAYGRNDALEVVHELMGKFQREKTDSIQLRDEDDFYHLFDPRVVPDTDKAFNAAIKSGLLVDQGEGNYRCPRWEIDNAKLIASWENGRKGGRPKKAKTQDSGSAKSQAKESTKETKGQNQTERNSKEKEIGGSQESEKTESNGRELNVIEGNERKEGAGFGSVKSNDNPVESQNFNGLNAINDPGLTDKAFETLSEESIYDQDEDPF